MKRRQGRFPHFPSPVQWWCLSAPTTYGIIQDSFLGGALWLSRSWELPQGLENTSGFVMLPEPSSPGLHFQALCSRLCGKTQLGGHHWDWDPSQCHGAWKGKNFPPPPSGPPEGGSWAGAPTQGCSHPSHVKGSFPSLFMLMDLLFQVQMTTGSRSQHVCTGDEPMDVSDPSGRWTWGTRTCSGLTDPGAGPCSWTFLRDHPQG